MSGPMGNIARNVGILVTGSTGRLGVEMTKTLSGSGYTVHQIKRGDPQAKHQHPLTHAVLDPASLTMEEWRKTMQENQIKIVLNLAAQSSGTLKAMAAVNTQMPVNIAEACKKLGIPMVHTCSHSTQLQGINPEQHPYASTKKAAAERLAAYPNVVIARLGAVLGGKSDIPVCTDAAVSAWSPVIMLPAKGGEQVFHPIDEATTIAALKGIVDHLTSPETKDQPLPRNIDIAGREVPLDKFLKMVNPKALATLPIPDVVLNLLAKLVNKGVFTKEFLSISKLSRNPQDKTTPLIDTSTMETILKVPAPTVEKVAEAARKQLSLTNTSLLVTRSFFQHLTKAKRAVLPLGVWPENFLTTAKRISTLLNESLHVLKK